MHSFSFFILIKRSTLLLERFHFSESAGIISTGFEGHRRLFLDKKDNCVWRNLYSPSPSFSAESFEENVVCLWILMKSSMQHRT